MATNQSINPQYSPLSALHNVRIAIQKPVCDTPNSQSANNLCNTSILDTTASCQTSSESHYIPPIVNQGFHFLSSHQSSNITSSKSNMTHSIKDDSSLVKKNSETSLPHTSRRRCVTPVWMRGRGGIRLRRHVSLKTNDHHNSIDKKIAYHPNRHNDRHETLNNTTNDIVLNVNDKEQGLSLFSNTLSSRTIMDHTSASTDSNYSGTTSGKSMDTFSKPLSSQYSFSKDNDYDLIDVKHTSLCPELRGLPNFNSFHYYNHNRINNDHPYHSVQSILPNSDICQNKQQQQPVSFISNLSSTTQHVPDLFIQQRSPLDTKVSTCSTLYPESIAYPYQQSNTDNSQHIDVPCHDLTQSISQQQNGQLDQSLLYHYPNSLIYNNDITQPHPSLKTNHFGYLHTHRPLITDDSTTESLSNDAVFKRLHQSSFVDSIQLIDSSISHPHLDSQHTVQHETSFQQTSCLSPKEPLSQNNASHTESTHYHYNTSDIHLSQQCQEATESNQYNHKMIYSPPILLDTFHDTNDDANDDVFEINQHIMEKSPLYWTNDIHSKNNKCHVDSIIKQSEPAYQTLGDNPIHNNLTTLLYKNTSNNNQPIHLNALDTDNQSVLPEDLQPTPLLYFERLTTPLQDSKTIYSNNITDDQDVMDYHHTMSHGCPPLSHTSQQEDTLTDDVSLSFLTNKTSLSPHKVIQPHISTDNDHIYITPINQLNKEDYRGLSHCSSPLVSRNVISKFRTKFQDSLLLPSNDFTVYYPSHDDNHSSSERHLIPYQLKDRSLLESTNIIDTTKSVRNKLHPLLRTPLSFSLQSSTIEQPNVCIISDNQQISIHNKNDSMQSIDCESTSILQETSSIKDNLISSGNSLSDIQSIQYEPTPSVITDYFNDPLINQETLITHDQKHDTSLSISITDTLSPHITKPPYSIMTSVNKLDSSNLLMTNMCSNDDSISIHSCHPILQQNDSSPLSIKQQISSSPYTDQRCHPFNPPILGSIEQTAYQTHHQQFDPICTESQILFNKQHEYSDCFINQTTVLSSHPMETPLINPTVLHSTQLNPPVLNKIIFNNDQKPSCPIEDTVVLSVTSSLCHSKNKLWRPMFPRGYPVKLLQETHYIIDWMNYKFQTLYGIFYTEELPKYMSSFKYSSFVQYYIQDESHPLIASNKGLLHVIQSFLTTDRLCTLANTYDYKKDRLLFLKGILFYIIGLAVSFIVPFSSMLYSQQLELPNNCLLHISVFYIFILMSIFLLGHHVLCIHWEHQRLRCSQIICNEIQECSLHAHSLQRHTHHQSIDPRVMEETTEQVYTNTNKFILLNDKPSTSLISFFQFMLNVPWTHFSFNHVHSVTTHRNRFFSKKQRVSSSWMSLWGNPSIGLTLGIGCVSFTCIVLLDIYHLMNSMNVFYLFTTMFTLMMFFLVLFYFNLSSQYNSSKYPIHLNASLGLLELLFDEYTTTTTTTTTTSLNKHSVTIPSGNCDDMNTVTTQSLFSTTNENPPPLYPEALIDHMRQPMECECIICTNSNMHRCIKKCTWRLVYGQYLRFVYGGVKVKYIGRVFKTLQSSNVELNTQQRLMFLVPHHHLSNNNVASLNSNEATPTLGLMLFKTALQNDTKKKWLEKGLAPDHVTLLNILSIGCRVNKHSSIEKNNLMKDVHRSNCCCNGTHRVTVGGVLHDDNIDSEFIFGAIELEFEKKKDFLAFVILINFFLI